MSKLSLEKKRKLIQILTVVGLILTVTGSVFIASSPYFKEGGGFGELLKSMGIFGPLLFLLLQISQTIYPIIPGGLHNVIGDVSTVTLVASCSTVRAWSSVPVLTSS